VRAFLLIAANAVGTASDEQPMALPGNDLGHVRRLAWSEARASRRHQTGIGPVTPTSIFVVPHATASVIA
jgi:hypothetical protein